MDGGSCPQVPVSGTSIPCWQQGPAFHVMTGPGTGPFSWRRHHGDIFCSSKYRKIKSVNRRTMESQRIVKSCIFEIVMGCSKRYPRLCLLSLNTKYLSVFWFPRLSLLQKRNFSFSFISKEFCAWSVNAPLKHLMLFLTKLDSPWWGYNKKFTLLHVRRTSCTAKQQEVSVWFHQKIFPLSPKPFRLY